MKKNKITMYLAFVIILFAFVLYFSLKDDYKDILNTLDDVNMLFLLIGVFFMFLSKYFRGCSVLAFIMFISIRLFLIFNSRELCSFIELSCPFPFTSRLFNFYHPFTLLSFVYIYLIIGFISK